MLQPLSTPLLAECTPEIPIETASLLGENIRSVTEIPIETASLADRIQIIRTSHDEFVSHARGMLMAGIAIGEELIPIRKELRRKRHWQRFMRNDLPFSPTTTRTYIRLAEHKTEIEAAKIGDIALTSIRAALRLIAKPKASGGQKPPRTEPNLQDVWSRASLEERRAVLCRMSLAEFLDSMPVLMRRRFEKTTPVKADVKKAPTPQGVPDRRASETLRRAVSLSRSDNQFDAAEAMTALRALDRMFEGAGIDEFTLVRRRTKAKRRAAA
jgi:hypothetical protein